MTALDAAPRAVADQTLPPVLRSALSSRWLGTVVVIVAMLMPWLGTLGHPLYAPDEGRYGSASLAMANGGSLVVPSIYGRPHLTKPPMTYWLQAAALRVAGRSEIGVRAPSLLATSLTILLVYRIGRGIRGRRLGVLAAGTLGMMPMFLAIGRVGTTDALLCLFWTSMLAAALEAVRSGRAIWWAAFWGAAALAALTKGPVVALPILIVMLWLGISGRTRILFHPGQFAGAVLAAVPFVVWAAAVIRLNPGALELWREQTVDRAITDTVRPEPWWFYIPIFFAGFYPTTAMLAVPGWNLPWRRAWRILRLGRVRALLVIAVVVPFLFFSAARGKMPTYILPMAPAMAILAALTLDRRVVETRHGLAALRRRGLRPPDIAYTLLVTAVLATVVMIIANVLLSGFPMWQVLCFLLVPAACAVMAAVWHRGGSWRLAGMLVVWCAWMAAIAWGTVMEDDVRAPTDPRPVLERLRERTGEERPDLAVIGLNDPSFFFYNDLHGDGRDTPPDPPVPGQLIMIAGDWWDETVRDRPDFAARYALVERLTIWPSRPAVILRRAEDPPLRPLDTESPAP